MKKQDSKFFEHPLVRQMYDNNEQFCLSVHENNYPIERLVSRPNRERADVIKVLAFGILGDQWRVVELLNRYHHGWRSAF